MEKSVTVSVAEATALWRFLNTYMYLFIYLIQQYREFFASARLSPAVVVWWIYQHGGKWHWHEDAVKGWSKARQSVCCWTRVADSA